MKKPEKTDDPFKQISRSINAWKAVTNLISIGYEYSKADKTGNSG
jgi:hypothetical protein